MQSELSSDIVVPLDKMEKNSLRYMAGYVIRALEKKMRHSTHPLKEEFS
jgi:hypothetical protein